jgi:nitroreductase
MSIDPSEIPPPPAENDLVAAIHKSPETLALMARRRSTKIAEFAEPGPDAAQIEALIRLAARAPDHGKLGPWRFVIISGEARQRAGAALAQIIAGENDKDASRIEFARTHFMRAPVCVMVVSTAGPHPKVPEWEQLLSSGAVCYGLLIAAHAMGFAGAWLTEWPTYDERARAALGLNAQERIAGLVFLGSAAKPAVERFRPDLPSRISHF